MDDRFCHLVFYDGECGLCDRVVQLLIAQDQQRLFVFASLQGKTASQYLSHLPAAIRFTDSLILIENYRSSSPRVHILAKGALRIAWLLGWPWLLVGWLSFFPGWVFGWVYRLIASHRHYFFSKTTCIVPLAEDQERFLP
ncbi:MAG: thiol-disulfide oxidoreductase DCC family protein [Parachlamydiaceae bacterium]